MEPATNKRTGRRAACIPTTFLIPRKIHGQFRDLFIRGSKASLVVKNLLHSAKAIINEKADLQKSRVTTIYQKRNQDLNQVSHRIDRAKLIPLTLLSRHLGVSRCWLFVSLILRLLKKKSRKKKRSRKSDSQKIKDSHQWLQLQSLQIWDVRSVRWRRRIWFYRTNSVARINRPLPYKSRSVR